MFAEFCLEHVLCLSKCLGTNPLILQPYSSFFASESNNVLIREQLGDLGDQDPFSEEMLQVRFARTYSLCLPFAVGWT